MAAPIIPGIIKLSFITIIRVTFTTVVSTVVMMTIWFVRIATTVIVIG